MKHGDRAWRTVSPGIAPVLKAAESTASPASPMAHFSNSSRRNCQGNWDGWAWMHTSSQARWGSCWGSTWVRVLRAVNGDNTSRAQSGLPQTERLWRSASASRPGSKLRVDQSPDRLSTRQCVMRQPAARAPRITIRETRARRAAWGRPRRCSFKMAFDVHARETLSRSSRRSITSNKRSPARARAGEYICSLRWKVVDARPSTLAQPASRLR